VHIPPAEILVGVRRYLAYPLSTRHVEQFSERRWGVPDCYFIRVEGLPFAVRQHNTENSEKATP
jgi:hypothetical protein